MLVGDSHLARLRRELRVLPGDVRNEAQGGAYAHDLRRQADAAGLDVSDAVVVSVGTNDAAPWKQVSMGEFARTLATFVASRTPRRWVFVAPPGVVEERGTRASDRTNAVIADYRRAVLEVSDDVGGHVVRADLLIESLGAEAFAADGVHLNGAGYRVLVPAIASACATP